MTPEEELRALGVEYHPRPGKLLADALDHLGAVPWPCEPGAARWWFSRGDELWLVAVRSLADGSRRYRLQRLHPEPDEGGPRALLFASEGELVARLAGLA